MYLHVKRLKLYNSEMKCYVNVKKALNVKVWIRDKTLQSSFDIESTSKPHDQVQYKATLHLGCLIIT